MTTRILTIACFCCLFASTATADLVNFRLDTDPTGSISGDTLTVTQTGLMFGGVTFDAVLTAVGNGNLSQNGAGVGVGGTTFNSGESIAFSVATSNESGGSINFKGFTELDFNSFTADSDNAEFSTGDTINGATAIDLFDLTTLTGGAPTSFTISAVAGEPGTNSFSLDAIAGHFEAVAVPEPSSWTVLGFGCVIGWLRRRRVPVT